MQGQPPTVADAIHDLMGSRGWRGLPQWVKRAAAPAPTIVGGSHKHGGPDLGPTRARREWAALGIDGLGLAGEPPARDFEGIPRLTIPMVARLQSFPDDWQFIGSKIHAYRQVGNALPVKLAYSVARAIKQRLI
jgi:DNA (cytosine-5)-methyltransferase 1